jgi:putative DNA primase/helicase
LLAVLGSYAVKAGYRLFYSTEHLPVPEDQIAELFGRRFVFASETKEGARLNEHTVKDITGGDTLRGCWKYKHGFNFMSQSTPWVFGNHKPGIKGTDQGNLGQSKTSSL